MGAYRAMQKGKKWSAVTFYQNEHTLQRCQESVKIAANLYPELN